MAEIGALILPIGADPSQFQKSIKDVKDQIRDLGKIIESTPFNLVTPEQKLALNALKETFKELTNEVKNFGRESKIPENSIQGLINKINELNKKRILLDATKSAAEIAKLNKKIDQLAQKRDNLNGLGRVFKDLPPEVDRANQSIKRGNTALTSFSLVLQDLPFGLIAIQNNIPNLIQQFGILQKNSGGIINAFKALGNSLVGPGGLLLAVSAVTAVITYAVKEYGSLGVAIKTVLGTITDLDKIQKRATDSLKDYNKEIVTNGEITANATASVSDQVFKIQVLSDAIKDVTLSETQRKNAIEELQKLDPKTLENLSTQTTNYKDLDEWVNKYTESLIANAVAQEYLSKVVATTTQINTQTNLLAEISKGYIDLAKQREKLSAQPIYDPATGAELTNTALVGLLAAEEKLNKTVADQTLLVNNLWKELDTYKESAKNATKEALKFNTETGKGVKESPLKIQSEDLDAAYNLEKIISKLEEYGNVLLDVNKPLKERKTALQEIIGVDNEYFRSLSLEANQLLNSKSSIEEYIRILKDKIKWQEFDKRASEINGQLLKLRTEEQDKLNKKLQEANKEYEDQFNNIANLTIANDQYGNSTAKITQQRFFSFGNLQYDIDKYKSSIENLGQVYDFTFEGLKKKNQEIFESIKGFLYQPIENLFDVILDKGKTTWKEFGDAVIATLKRIAAQLIATGIAKGIANLIAPGLGSISTGAFGDYLDSLPFAANFGGVQGGLGLTGQVVFRQSGSDLVGVLNRTNATINRVG